MRWSAWPGYLCSRSGFCELAGRHMDHVRRRGRIAEAIARAASEDGPPARLCHVCQAALRVIPMSGASLSLADGLGLLETVAGTDATSLRAAEQQVVLGVGPAMEAVSSFAPVLAYDLSDPATWYKWPRLSSALWSLRVTAVFAFPLVVDEAAVVGVLELYRRWPGPLAPGEIADAEALAAAAVAMLVGYQRGRPGELGRQGAGPLGEHWALVYQAVDAVSAQLRSDASEAYLRLRAYAFLSNRRLLGAAEDVLAGRVRFRSHRSE